MDSPIYRPKVSINGIDDLAAILGITPQELLRLSFSAKSYYRPNRPELKPDGTTRQTYRVLTPLKEVQGNINKHIFYDVYFPAYLLGGIKDIENPRDYVRSASMHVGSKIFIKEDIFNFFPSIRAVLVYHIWHSFFSFPTELCKILTNLTTYNGFVPQGASTSTYLANLVFWETEPELEHTLSQNSCNYSRLVDDITISSTREILHPEQQHITEMIYRMLFRLRFKPKRRKRKVMTLKRRVNIHSLNLNSGKPTLSKLKRREIRKAVYECEKTFSAGLYPEVYEKLFDSVRGQVAHLQRFHPNQAEQYIKRLDLIRPEKITGKGNIQ